jgi:hypothetical protein
MATDRCSNVTEIISCRLSSPGQIIPSTPAKGPVSTLTGVPLGMYAQGSRKRSLDAKSCSASISLADTPAGLPPKLTILETPGVDTALPIAEELNRQNIYLGKSGSSIVTVRSDHRRFRQYVGSRHSYPFWLSERSTFLSPFGRVCRTNHGVILLIESGFNNDPIGSLLPLAGCRQA